MFLVIRTSFTFLCVIVALGATVNANNGTVTISEDASTTPLTTESDSEKNITTVVEVISETANTRTSKENYETISSTTTRSRFFEFPRVKIELLPVGYRVSVPVVENITSFTFNAKINQPLIEHETGTFSQTSTVPQNDRFVIEDLTTKLKKGDVIYYWVHYGYNDSDPNSGYYQDKNEYLVDTDKSSFIQSLTTPRSKDQTEYSNTHPHVQVMDDGFSVFITDQQGIKSFTFNGNLDKSIKPGETGNLSQTISNVYKGRWTYTTPTLNLSSVNSLNFWTNVEFFDGNDTMNLTSDMITIELDKMRAVHAVSAARVVHGSMFGLVIITIFQMLL